MSDPVMEYLAMYGVEPMEQCKRALAHVLARISDDPAAWRVMGFGTESWALLTEAAATAYGEDIVEVRERFCARAKCAVEKRRVGKDVRGQRSERGGQYD